MRRQHDRRLARLMREGQARSEVGASERLAFGRFGAE
jgi:hypothetical protein